VFGRGGEEALALVAAGIPFEVVPGVSSAVAAAELAGIPVTHRGVSAAFVVVSGHAPGAYEPVLTTLAPQSATVVVLMGLASAGSIAATLTAHGWKPATAAAIIRGASTEGAELWTGTLAELASAAEQSESERPGTIVIGDVVRVGAMLADLETESEQDEAFGRAAAR
jgi:siroheme synthase